MTAFGAIMFHEIYFQIALLDIRVECIEYIEIYLDKKSF